MEAKEILKMPAYLPARIGVPVEEEDFLDPFVDGGQCHFVLVGLHGHANERGVRVRWLRIAHNFVIDFDFFLFFSRCGIGSLGDTFSAIFETGATCIDAAGVDHAARR